MLLKVGIEFLPYGGVFNASKDTLAGLSSGDYTTAVIGVVGLIMEFVPWAKVAKIASKVYDIGKSAFKMFKLAYDFIGNLATAIEKGFKAILNSAGDLVLKKGDEVIASGDNAVRSFFKAFGTKIDDAVVDITKVDLPPLVANTFTDGAYRTVKTIEPVSLNRAFGGDAKLNGGFATTKANATRGELALLDEWNNTMRFEAKINVPSGQTLNIGKVAPQTSSNGLQTLTGGEDQILMPQNWNVQSWVGEIIDKTTGNIYTYEQFINAFPHLIN